MNKRPLAVFAVVGICMCFFFLFGRTESILSEQSEMSDSPGRPIFLSGTDLFAELERPPVKFYHDRHTTALKNEGCGACHPQMTDGTFLFIYPKVKYDKTEKNIMKSSHESCIGCHNDMLKQGKKSGFVTCGECHAVKERRKETAYVPIGPDYYEHLEDTYHTNCLLCHKDGENHVKKHPEALNWKDFYVKKKEEEKLEWPQAGFNYDIHYQHERALEEKCQACHHTYDETEGKLVYERGTESSCRDCHGERDEGNILSFRNVAHKSCISCHMDIKQDKIQSKELPLHCGGCHLEEAHKAARKMEYSPRPNQGQPEKVLIHIAGAKMNGVPFDHKNHETYTPTCRTCHHEGLNACSDCHTEKGSSIGGGINLAQAYHAVSAEHSCIGCHNSEISQPNCAGCHQSMNRGLNKDTCNICHAGSVGASYCVEAAGNTNQLFPENLPEEMLIRVLEKDYEPAKFPHADIVKKLTDISN
ncbi:MAG: cytochrome c3 family protein, partial [Thermodesulfobacteriota bacterium]|nr:cytochrome c3 family protein [Thermodesulfobacteriota bacterium]